MSNPVGRPSDYSDEILKKTIEFYESYANAPKLIEVQVLNKAKNLVTVNVPNPMAIDPPYIEALELELDVDDDTIVEWAKVRYPDDHEKSGLRGKLKHPEFSATIKKIKKLQLLRLYGSTLDRNSATGAIFQLKVNHGKVEVNRTEHTAKDGKSLLEGVPSDVLADALKRGTGSKSPTDSGKGSEGNASGS